ncbi:MAG: hypothetical protein U0002_01615 [Thermoanaerobaculia bacterium]
MSLDQALYREFDPTRPLEAGEAEYVDWQKELGLDDVKPRLARSLSLSLDAPVCRLFTGHRGIGKTTELKRVKRLLEEGAAGQRYFVCYLESERWLDLEDVQAPEVVLHIVRQIVDDLRRKEVPLGESALGGFLNRLTELMKSEVELKEVKVPAGLVDFGFAIKDVTHARRKLRELLEGRLPDLYDLVNREVLEPARRFLAKPENGGYAGVVVIVDELDRIPQKVLNDQGLTNHENLFLDNARRFRALACHVVYTLPIELAYSTCRGRLQATYGTEILHLPVMPVCHRDGGGDPKAVAMLQRLVEARLAKAGATVQQCFAAPELLERLCRLSGGHFRNLFLLMRSALERSGALPLAEPVITRAVRRQAVDLSIALRREDWEILRRAHASKQAEDGDSGSWLRLLKDGYAFAYEDEQGAWYDWNPLLAEVSRGE